MARQPDASQETILSPTVFERRYFPGRAETGDALPGAKHRRRPLSGWSQEKLYYAEQAYWNNPDDEQVKQHYLTLAAANQAQNRQQHAPSLGWWDRSSGAQEQRGQRHIREGRAIEIVEGHDLARSSLHLPSDRTARGGRRPPSLERQDAFRDPHTSKTSNPALLVSQNHNSSGKKNKNKRTFRQHLLSGSNDDFPEPHGSGDYVDPGDDIQVEDLYRRGILYDNEFERGSGFGFDAIVHNGAPRLFNVYEARPPVKRGRSAHGTKLNPQPNNNPADLSLPLDLSRGAFGEDSALAAFLISSDDGVHVSHYRDTGVDPASIFPPVWSEPPSPMKMVLLGGAPSPRVTISYELDKGAEATETRTTATPPRISTITTPPPPARCYYVNASTQTERELADWYDGFPVASATLSAWATATTTIETTTSAATSTATSTTEEPVPDLVFDSTHYCCDSSLHHDDDDDDSDSDDLVSWEIILSAEGFASDHGVWWYDGNGNAATTIPSPAARAAAAAKTPRSARGRFFRRLGEDEDEEEDDMDGDNMMMTSPDVNGADADDAWVFVVLGADGL
ncbi:hypothetical protein B0T24DRAFT_362951 [Lasiosphaeria ovina]|uniref:Uncharacterized protein n=1 Tax=Lasiosphaeria ovina TaxID=92902 RepID=A0AAE0N500_9PEZI|nr:hypothetical protein B0T24DRAFT_362951 [Lasiosphaeria ovina]